MIKKRNRKELYDKFRQGAIPSGADFADFIRSQVNVLDDGIDISDDPDDPISIRAKGEDENLLDFSDPENRKRWRVSGRSEDLSREGLNITADGKTNLFIERDTGSVGINTDQPQAKLHIKQINSPDAVRIDDEGNDVTPLVITNEGKVGIGIGNGTSRPDALLHVNNTGPGDALRVGNSEEAKAHFVVNHNGYTSLGFEQPSPNARLVVNGAVSIGSTEVDPGSDGLYVRGDVKIDGNIVFTDRTNKGGIELSGLIKAKDDEVVIKDNVKIIADPEQAASQGNLYVEGDTTLGTFGKDNMVSINGAINSGFDPNPQSDEIQPELVVNEILTINRKPGEQRVKVSGPLDVRGSSTLGNNSASDLIHLNGRIKREGSNPVTIEDDLYIEGDVNVQNVTIRQDLTVTAAVKGKNLKLDKGPVIDEFSTDQTLSGDSNSAVPTEQAVKRYVDILLAGSITAFSMPSPPTGWLECNGQAVSRSHYQRLYALIGTRYGSGNGSTTFNLPDLRNQFIRGAFLSNPVGAIQNDSTAFPKNAFCTHNRGDHSHIVYYYHAAQKTHGSATEADLKRDYGEGFSYKHTGSSGNHNHPIYGGDPETRPRNVALLFCIKH